MTIRDRNHLHLHPNFWWNHLGPAIEDWNAHKDDKCGLFEGARTFQRQEELYAIGRTVDGASCVHAGVIRPLGTCALHPRGLVVTMARPGYSWHCYSTAGDVVFDADPRKPDLQASWDSRFPWNELGAHCQRYGLEWAGAWKRFREAPHMQMTFGLQINEAYELFQSGGLPAVWGEMREP